MWCCPVRWEWRCGVGGPPATADLVPPLATSERAGSSSTALLRARRSRRYDGSSCSSSTGGSRRRPRCAPAASASATSRRPRPTSTSTNRRPPCWSRSPQPRLLATRCRRRQPGLRAHRRVRPVDAPARRPSAGSRSSGPGWRARLPGLVGSRDPVGKVRSPRCPASTRSRDPADDPRGGRRAHTRRGARHRDRPRLAGPADRVAAPASSAHTGRPGRVGGREATTLGLAALGGAAVRPRAARRTSRPCSARLLPAPVDHVLLQADLTAVAPGPLESELARRLQLVADVESRGGATVYRFTSGSVRRALDIGWSAVEVQDFITSVSRTPVPQPLTYLVDDTARTFGNVRVGHAEAFLRADDETALTELLHHPKAGTLGLRRLAPTVLISSTPLDVLLPRLRDLGVAPVVEAADGTVHVARPDVLRARTPRERRGKAVRSARASAQVAQSSPRSGPATAPRRTARSHPPSHSPERLDGGTARGDRRPGHRADRLRRQPRHQHRAAGRSAHARRRVTHRARPPQRRRAHLRRAPDNNCPPVTAAWEARRAGRETPQQVHPPLTGPRDGPSSTSSTSSTSEAWRGGGEL